MPCAPKRFAVFAFALLCAVMLAAGASAQTARNLEDVTKPLAGWKTTVDRIEQTLSRAEVSEETFVIMQEELDRIRAETEAFVEKHTPWLEEAQARLTKLGPAPDEAAGAAPESELTAKERETDTKLVAALDGAIKTADVLALRATQLLRTLQARRYEQMSKQLLKRTASPLRLAVWRDVSRAGRIELDRLRDLTLEWRQTIERPVLAAVLAAAALAVWLLGSVIAAHWISRFRRLYGMDPPSFFAKAASSVWVAAARAAPPVGAALLLYGGFTAFDLLTPRFGQLLYDAAYAFAVVAAIIALATTLLAPNRPAWRIFPASDDTARRLRRLVAAGVIIFGLGIFLDELDRLLFSPITLSVARNFVLSLVFAALLAAILRTSLGAEELGEKRKLPLWRRVLRFVLWTSVIAIVASATLGYIALANFIAKQVLVTGSILVAVYLLRITIDAVAESMTDAEMAPGRWLEREVNLSQARRAQLAMVIQLILTALLLVVAVPLILLQWGFGWDDVHDWMYAAFFGFQIGGVRISLAVILAAFAIFLIGLVLTRFAQSWFDNRVLAGMRFERGVRNSLKTAFGYLGVIVAGVVAITYTGVDFSNVAIVAGALSVGIGLGLQGIVNNFVSGLILLAERPIKVGDWIIVGTEEGHVSRVSVRATEIETFDRSHVIIPNSELITGTVKNWTYRSDLGRIIIPIGVSYDSDAEQVRDLLLAIAREHPDVMDEPGPLVFFEDFGSSSLDFTLRAYLRDVNRSLTVRSELRFAILKAFRDAGIEIPFPQRDINLRDMSRIEKALATHGSDEGTGAS